MELNQTSVSNTRNTNGNGNTSLALVPLADMQAMAKIGVESGFFGIKKPTEAMALMLIAQAEGKHPATVFSQYHVIQGRPALKADAMLARFQQAGGSVQWTERTDKACAATFTHSQGGRCEIRWTLDDAKRAGLLGGKSNWTQYPRQMLSARVVSEGVRAVFPGVLGGFYTPEEVSQFEASKVAPRATEPNYEPAPRLTDIPEVIEAEAVLVDPPMPDPAARASKPAPIRKPQPVAAEPEGADMTTAVFLGLEVKHGEGKKGPWTCYKPTLEIGGRKFWPSTFEHDLGGVLGQCSEGDTVLVKLEERSYAGRDGETKKAYDLKFVTKSNVPNKPEDFANDEELGDEIPF